MLIRKTTIAQSMVMQKANVKRNSPFGHIESWELDCQSAVSKKLSRLA